MNAAIEWLSAVVGDLFDHVVRSLGNLASLDHVWHELGAFTVLYPTAMCLLWIFFAFLFVFRREWRLPMDKNPSLRVAIVVPAHNEELVIAATIESLLAQGYPHKQIHVVSDGSSDATVAIARGYEARGVVVHDLKPNRGKSGALQYVLDLVETDLFMVVDADTIAAPDAVLFMVQQMADGRIGAVTGRPHVRNADTFLTRIQAMEYSVIISLAKRAESFWGGLYTVSGAASCFRTAALKEVGGWSSHTVTEDIEVSWRMQKAGYEIAYEPRALFHIQTPRALGALYRQRRRWARGMAEVLREHCNLLHSRNLALIPILFQVLATVVWFALVLGTLGQGLWWLLVHRGASTPILLNAFTGQGAWVILLGTTILFAIQAFAACVFDGHYTGGMMRLVPLSLLYPIYYWVVVFPCFVLGFARGLWPSRSGKWQRTTRLAE